MICKGRVCLSDKMHCTPWCHILCWYFRSLSVSLIQHLNNLCCVYVLHVPDASASVWNRLTACIAIYIRGMFHCNIYSLDCHSSHKSYCRFFDPDRGVWNISFEGDLGHFTKWSGHHSIQSAVQKKWEYYLGQWSSHLRLTSSQLYYSDWTGCWHWVHC